MRTAVLKSLACCGAAALLLLALGPASAQDRQQRTSPQGAAAEDAATNSGGPGAGEGKRRANTMPEQHDAKSDKPPLQLSDAQRSAIEQAVSGENTDQKTPPKFEVKIGAKIPTAIKPHPLPRPLINREPVLKQYDYAKLDQEVVVIDPMDQKIVDVIPRQTVASGKAALKPVDWAATKGRELIGKAPEAPAATTGSDAAKK